MRRGKKSKYSWQTKSQNSVDGLFDDLDLEDENEYIFGKHSATKFDMMFRTSAMKMSLSSLQSSPIRNKLGLKVKGNELKTSKNTLETELE